MRGLSQKRTIPAAIALVFGLMACSVITEKGVDTIVFSHHLHTEQGVGCSDCHSGIEQSTQTTGEAIPRKTGCSDCHDVEEKGGCALCHRNPAKPGPEQRVRETYLVFSHLVHADTGSECEDCHRGAAHWPDFAGGRDPSKMGHGDCSSCHKQELDNANCKKCHENLDVNAYKAREIYAHEPGFFKTHGVQAGANAAGCARCHDQSYCADCHDGNAPLRPSIRFPERVDRTFIHRGDWMSRHSLETRIGDPGCAKCHGSAFCSSCHETNGVGGALGQLNPHRNQPNWMAGSGPGSHGQGARRRIGECAACHDQGAASNCVECHSQRGTHSFNPHPPGWNPPVPRGERTTHKMCRICHL